MPSCPKAEGRKGEGGREEEEEKKINKGIDKQIEDSQHWLCFH